ncbi:MAG: glycerophosphodiester phosphodiesterase family protein [Pseudomonadota bacterium]
MNIPELVAHRGYMLAYPENTLSAIRAALELGCPAVEFDVHLSRDGVPMVFHDRELNRTTGQEGRIFDLTADELVRIDAAQTDRFGEKYRGEKIPRLDAMVALIAHWPQAKMFVEIKRKSLQQFGHARVWEQVHAVIQPHLDQAVVISYDVAILERARASGVPRIGWVIEHFDAATRQQAEALRPEYLFGDVDEIPADLERFWPGPWQWVIFDVIDPALALNLAQRGADIIETKAVAEMYRDPTLARKRAAYAKL